MSDDVGAEEQLDEVLKDLDAAEEGASTRGILPPLDASDSGALRQALARQQAVEHDLRQEMARLRTELASAQERLVRAEGRFVPAAPVAFLTSDGRAIARKAFYALGRGEGLEELLADLVRTWEATGRLLSARYDRGGVLITLEEDPDHRSIRLLPSGVYLVRLSPEELAALGDLPPLVRRTGNPAPPPEGEG